MGRLSLGLGFGIGYVLGARAGRSRYEQIARAAADVVQRPDVRDALDRARAALPAPLQDRIDRLSGSRSGGRGDGSPSIADAAPEPSRQAAGTGTGGPAAADAPLPDPLVPPARSGDGPGAQA